ncbi:MAG: hypothetical protein INF93_14070 [Rhodobacter sp.]|nr:hypothetical protein [Rhodobacter sp.]
MMELLNLSGRVVYALAAGFKNLLSRSIASYNSIPVVVCFLYIIVTSVSSCIDNRNRLNEIQKDPRWRELQERGQSPDNPARSAD